MTIRSLRNIPWSTNTTTQPVTSTTPTGRRASASPSRDHMRESVIVSGPERSAAGLGRDHLDRVSDGADLVRIVVAELDAEGVLQLEHDVDEPGRVHLEILEDAGLEARIRQRFLVLGERLDDLDHPIHDVVAHGK